jgi:hypothetical protein
MDSHFLITPFSAKHLVHLPGSSLTTAPSKAPAKAFHPWPALMLRPAGARADRDTLYGEFVEPERAHRQEAASGLSQ